MSRTPPRLSPVCASRRVLALEFIRRYFSEHGTSPSFGEVAAALNMPRQRVGLLVRDFAASGALTFTRGEPRSIRLVDRLANFSNTELKMACRSRGIALADAAPPPDHGDTTPAGMLRQADRPAAVSVDLQAA